MDTPKIFTIGHGLRKPEDFLALLRLYNIEFLVDVRSVPFSKNNPAYNQNELKYFLVENGIRYVFMGDSIGGRPKDSTCYDKEGKVDYEIVKTKDFFQDGICRLKTAYEKQVRLALMCSESKPCECHRSKLIGKVLESSSIEIVHIDEKGIAKPQNLVISELNKGLPEIDLFGNSINSTSRKSYL